MRACARVALASIAVSASFSLSGCAAVEELKETFLPSRDYSGFSRLLLCYALEAPAVPGGFLVSPVDRRVRIFSVKNVRVAVLRASD
jgi:hypothetical protein